MTSEPFHRPSFVSTPGRVAGIVIAGGRSVRFGGEKAAALLGGRPLILRAAARLRRNCEEIAANVRRDTEAERIAAAEHLSLLYDESGDALGPLAGIKVGLKWARDRGATLLAVSPCDAPLLPADLYDRLLTRGRGMAAMAETDRGPEPLCALWPVSALPVITAALAEGAHPSLWRTLDGIGAVRVRFDPPTAFANVNTRADLETIAARHAADMTDAP